MMMQKQSRLLFIGGEKVNISDNNKNNMIFPFVSVVIVTKDRVKDTIECIQSVLKSNYSRYEIILVDNGSKDDTVKIVKEMFTNINIIANEKNLGLSEGRNLGQRSAKGEYILFLDSDTSIDSAMIAELVSILINNRKIAFSSPKMYSYFEPRRIWYAGAFFNLVSGRARNFGELSIDNGQFDNILTTSHAPTAFMIRKDVADALGGHDNIFIMSYADSDFCIRIWKAGYIGVYVPKAILFHKVHHQDQSDSLRSMGMNTPSRAYYYARNKVIFMKRHTSHMGFIAFLLIFFPIYHIYYTRKILKNILSRPYLIYYWKGVIDGVKYVFLPRLIKN